MIKVLVISDDYWHPGDVIERGLKPLDGEEFELDFIRTAKDILTPEFIAGYQVILNCKGNSLNAANRSSWFDENTAECLPNDLAQYVKNGGGFISLHAGNTSKEGDPYTEFVGNRFITHPPRCAVEAKIVAKHPVTEGVSDFQIRDEHYEIKVVADDATILMRTVSETGGDQVAGYVREMGEGRLCVLTPGHILGVFLNPDYKRMIENAIRWCAKA